ncbi:MAG: PhnA domain-containing protein [Arcobacter sp.]|nr:PhnA domain-containing protein [Arcobacter sp.]
MDEKLITRANHKCELCGAIESLSALEVAPSDGSVEQSICVCNNCREQIEDNSKLDANHWHCLSDSMWSEIPAVQVMSYRLLKKLNNQELLDMLYLEDDVKAWADNEVEAMKAGELPKDSNGTILNQGDSVTIIKDLEVKGANFTAKRGTLVKGIMLNGNSEQVEGKVNGTRIVLLSCFLKKV